jgi:hypothetical protein
MTQTYTSHVTCVTDLHSTLHPPPNPPPPKAFPRHPHPHLHTQAVCSTCAQWYESGSESAGLVHTAGVLSFAEHATVAPAGMYIHQVSWVCTLHHVSWVCAHQRSQDSCDVTRIPALLTLNATLLPDLVAGGRVLGPWLGL